jgi:tol-pal system protein YbgF
LREQIMIAESAATRTAARVGARWLAAVALSLGLLVLVAAPATDAQAQSLAEEVKRLQRELNTLQRYVYKAEQPPASAITEVYGAEGAVTKTQAARLELRLSQLEAELRTLTGQIEEQTFRISRMNGRMDKLVADVDTRLRALEERTGGRPPGPVAEGSGLEAQQPGILGTVNEEAMAAVRTPTVEPGSAVESGQPVTAPSTSSAGGAGYNFPSAVPEDRYNHAFSLLSQANYDEAERALRAFLAQHGDHQLAGNAKYWLGETHYVRGQYQDAAVTFAEGFQQYPESTKAPDNLLKLGKSLAALGATTDACGTYSELLRRFPGATATLLQQAERERKRLACP